MSGQGPLLDRFGRGLIGTAFAFAVLGVIALLLAGAWEPVGAGLLGAAAALGAALAFYLVGRSEDRERARTRRRRS